ncbi:MAG: ABC transporter substrate-binding protein [Paracoccaceae bacterium]|nr:ABC transporter substrate-binding protein [Paracoccaceae bacterium]
MIYKKTILSAIAVIFLVSPVFADLVFPSLSYRTGPYGPNGIPFADGYADYFTLMNERDGGIGGEKVRMIECETGYNTEKGVECYESTKGEGALLYQPLSTGITYQLIPKASADNIPVLSSGYGRTSAKNGKIFKWIFNFPGTYWDAASIATKHAIEMSGGSLDGKKVALVYHNSGYGKEPIRTLEELSKKHKFELMLLPVDHPGQEQKSQWLQIRRERPDYIFMWGWGVMNSVAIQEAANIRFPMENFIGVWWSGSENDVIPAGDAAHGYKSLAMHAPGDNFPVYDDMRKYVIDKGLGAGDGSNVGTVLYSRGMYAAILAVEGAKSAQAIHGVSKITPSMMRDGLEALDITEEKLASIGLAGFAPTFKATCENHGGTGSAAVQQWDAKKGTWSFITDYMTSDQSVIQPLIDADSAQFAAENNIKERCN